MGFSGQWYELARLLRALRSPLPWVLLASCGGEANDSGHPSESSHSGGLSSSSSGGSTGSASGGVTVTVSGGNDTGGTGTIENIYWSTPTPPRGTYTVEVHNYSACGSYGPTPVQVSVSVGGRILGVYQLNVLEDQRLPVTTFTL